MKLKAFIVLIVFLALIGTYNWVTSSNLEDFRSNRSQYVEAHAGETISLGSYFQIEPVIGFWVSTTIDKLLPSVGLTPLDGRCRRIPFQMGIEGENSYLTDLSLCRMDGSFYYRIPISVTTGE